MPHHLPRPVTEEYSKWSEVGVGDCNSCLSFAVFPGYLPFGSLSVKKNPSGTAIGDFYAPLTAHEGEKV